MLSSVIPPEASSTTRPAVIATGDGGKVTFGRTGTVVDADGSTPLLEAGEAAGVLMPSGCRMGICFSCVLPMTEGVIRTLVGGRDVMRDQLRHLIEVTQEYPVTIHILPFSAGALPGSDNFVIFEFPDDLDGDVVYVESDTAQRIYEDRNPVRQCTYTFDAALAQALPARESQDLIRTVMEEL